MRFEVQHAPTFTTLRVDLDNGDVVFAQPDSMVSMTTRVVVSAKLGGQQGSKGLVGGVRNMLTGESLFAAVFTATDDKQELVLAPDAIGEVFSLDLDGGAGYYLSRGAYLASTPGVRLEAKYGGVRGWLAAKGLFLMQARGEGTLFCASHGAVVRRELADAERFVVDNKYVVAFSESVEYQLVKATSSVRDSVMSGEGLVNRYTGPGTVYYQTRSRPTISGLVGWLFQAAT
ncbi:MAG: TIGR00266 family protein [Lacipirellulaceae bacterium]